MGRFAQADSLVPGGVQGLDHYAYVNNNPINYTDPSGHCGSYVSLQNPIWCGVKPDSYGIKVALSHMSPGARGSYSGDIRVAAAIAVQSQWPAPWNDHKFAPLMNGGENSGYGIGNISDAEVMELGYQAGDQMNPSIAIRAMGHRIDSILALCKGRCSAVDKLIATALAQNHGFGDLKDLLGEARGGGIDWLKYFNTRNSTPDRIYPEGARAAGIGGFDTEFMLLLYTNDLLELYRLGWELPYGLTYEDIINIRKTYIYHTNPEDVPPPPDSPSPQ